IPNAPLRVTNSSGLEFNFVPGTPSSMIRLQLEQTPEAAMAALKYMDTTWGEYKKSAGLYQNAMWEAGPLKNIIGLERAKAIADAPKQINTQDISVSVFVHSMCGACEVQLATYEKLQERYPNLKITVFQFDENPDGFKIKVTDKGLKGRMLNALEAHNALKAGVEKWPTSWIDNTRMKQRESLAGVKSIVQLEERLQGMSRITTAKK
ncbi:TlpA family protein disulfide reductase, partial [Pseudomonas syringae]|uniref:TlpA family protein disulfide reductase n=1 Tax=Pseudomonas syringae TaxID=317 RepID=UPI001F447B60